MASNRSMRMPVSLAAVSALSLLFAASARADDDESESQIKRGFQIVPQGVYLNLKGKNRALVGLGSYIVNTGGCNDCHTHPEFVPGGDPFQGQPEMINFSQYLTGGRKFGPFTSANLTPDGSGNAGRPHAAGVHQDTAHGAQPERPAGPDPAGHAVACDRQEDRPRLEGDLRVPARATVAAEQSKPGAIVSDAAL